MQNIVAAIVFLLSANVYAWGIKAHELTTGLGIDLVEKKILENCKIDNIKLIEHSKDPDLIWKRDRRKHPDEAEAHFFHVDTQKDNWKDLVKVQNIENGYLPYRIISWIDQAKKFKKNEDWNNLDETLYGLTHYLGDLTMPLHLTSNFDGKKNGLSGIHNQWESKMIYRYKNDFKSDVRKLLVSKKIPEYWKAITIKELIYTIAEQSYKKSDLLYKDAAKALVYVRKKSKKHRKSSIGTSVPKARFSKPLLKQYTGQLAVEQMALASELIAFVIYDICK